MAVIKTIGTGAGLNVTPDYASIAAWQTYLTGLGTLTTDQIGRVLWASSANELILAGEAQFSGVTPGSFSIILEAGDANGAAGGSFNTNANKLTNPLRYDATKGACIRKTSGTFWALATQVGNVTIRNLQIQNASTAGGTFRMIGGPANTILDSCILHNAGTTPDDCVQAGGSGFVVKNCAIINGQNNAGGPAGLRVLDLTASGNVTNCTFVQVLTTGTNCGLAPSGTTTFNATNLAFLGNWDQDFGVPAGGAVAINNCATTFSSVTSGLTGTFKTGGSHQFDAVTLTEIVSITSGSEDLRLASTSVKCRDKGTSTGAPVVDIVGTTRPA